MSLIFFLAGAFCMGILVTLVCILLPERRRLEPMPIVSLEAARRIADRRAREERLRSGYKLPLSDGPGPLPSRVDRVEWVLVPSTEEWRLAWTATYDRDCGPVTICESLDEAEL